MNLIWGVCVRDREKINSSGNWEPWCGRYQDDETLRHIMAIALVDLYIKGGGHEVLAFANGRLFHN